MIEVKNITKKYGAKKALDNVSFKVEKGEIVGFLGPNAAGKSTTMRIITGYMPQTSGQVIIDGYDNLENSLEARKKIGYMPENVALYQEMRVGEYLLFIAKLLKVKKEERPQQLSSIMKKCGLLDVKDQLIATLSKGYKQRVGLAQALLGDPEILILDEPTIGLDPKQITEIRKLIKEIGKEKTVILSTHILPEVEMTCNRVIIINQGKLVASGNVETLTAGIEKGEVIVATVEGDVAQIKNKLAGIKEISEVNIIEKKSTNQAVVEIKSLGNKIDLRPLVSKALIENDFSLLEIKKKKLDLEDIFLKITTNENKK